MSRLLLVELPQRLTAVEGVAPGAPGWELRIQLPPEIMIGTPDMIPTMLFDAICQGPIDGFLGGVFNTVEKY